MTYACFERRIKKEIDDLKTDPPQGFSLHPDPDDMHKWKAVLRGPKGTPYEGGNINVQIDLPKEYPLENPVFAFQPPLFHLNVSHIDGRPTLDSLENGWSPALSIRHVCKELIELMKEPDPDGPMESKLADLYLHSRTEYEKLAREWTQRNAIP